MFLLSERDMRVNTAWEAALQAAKNNYPDYFLLQSDLDSALATFLLLADTVYSSKSTEKIKAGWARQGWIRALRCIEDQCKLHNPIPVLPIDDDWLDLV